jgi:hypothetical protein
MTCIQRGRQQFCVAEQKGEAIKVDKYEIQATEAMQKATKARMSDTERAKCEAIVVMSSPVPWL